MKVIVESLELALERKKQIDEREEPFWLLKEHGIEQMLQAWQANAEAMAKVVFIQRWARKRLQLKRLTGDDLASIEVDAAISMQQKLNMND